MEKIKSISEAYSVNPKRFVANTEHCHKIILEEIQVGNGQYGYLNNAYCVGYNLEGEKIFQYLLNSVNIEFITEGKND